MADKVKELISKEEQVSFEDDEKEVIYWDGDMSPYDYDDYWDREEDDYDEDEWDEDEWDEDEYYYDLGIYPCGCCRCCGCECELEGDEDTYDY